VADAQKTIELIFQGVDKTGAATQAALNNAEKFSSSIKNVTQPIADFTAGALKLEAGLLAAGAAVVAFSVRSAADFDSAFRQISTIIDASAEDLDGFKKAILDYASTSTQPLEKITNALGNAIGSGVDWSESLSLISTAEKLAVATRSDLDGTTKVLVSTLNSYGMSIDEAGKVSDLFFKIIDEGDIGMNDLAASFAKVAPVAKISGVSLEEVGAAIATLTASGIKPAESIEYLRGAISNIISPSGQARDVAAELGIEFNAAGLKANGLAGLLQQVADKTGGSADQMKVLFGDIGGFTAAATLAGPQAEKFRDTLASMGDVAGATDEAFKKITGSLDVSGQKIASAFNALAVSIGQPLLDEFGGVAEAIAKIFQSLGASVTSGSLKELVDYIESNMQGVQKALEQVAKNLPEALKNADLSGFIGGIDAVTGAFTRLFGGIDITTVDGLTRAIEVAGAAFLGLSKFTEGVIESFKPLFDQLVKIAGQVDGINPGFLEMAGNISGAVTQFNVLAGGISGILPWLETLVGLLVAKEGMSLIGGLQKLTTTLPMFSAALQSAGVVFAAYFASEKIVQLVDALGQWWAANEKLKESQKQAEEVNKRAGTTLERFAETTGIAVKTIDEASKLIDDGKVVWSEAANGWVKAGDALANVSKTAKDSVNPFEAANNAMLAQAAAAEKAGGSVKGLGGAQTEVYENVKKIVPVFDAATGKITGYREEMVRVKVGVDEFGAKTGKASESVAKIAKETEKAQEAQRKWAEELAKMDFQKSMELIKQQTALMVANIEADTKKAVAAFESLNTGITSTGQVLTQLFKSYENYDNLSWGAIDKIEAQMERENAYREKQFALQERMTEAQIKSMNAQTDALLKGDGLIKIDGAGLKPHLEAFMWEILQAIQVRVNADGLKLLLGV